MKYLSLFLILAFAFCDMGWAFTTKIEVPFEEIKQASYEVLASEGIHKQDEDGDYVESRWIQDEIKTESRMFSMMLPKQNYKRRYRIGVRLKRLSESTEVQVLGIFQRKLKKSGKQAPWRFYKIGQEEYAVEKDFFMKILRQLEANRI